MICFGSAYLIIISGCLTFRGARIDEWILPVTA